MIQAYVNLCHKSDWSDSCIATIRSKFTTVCCPLRVEPCNRAIAATNLGGGWAQLIRVPGLKCSRGENGPKRPASTSE